MRVILIVFALHLHVTKLNCNSASGGTDSIGSNSESLEDPPDVKSTSADQICDKGVGALSNVGRDDQHSSKLEAPVGKEASIQIDDIEKGVVSDANASMPHRWPCVATNLTQVEGTPLVLLLSNDEKIMAILQKLNQTSSCALVLFYSPYCDFSMKLSPLYNAIGRVYRDLAVMAIDAQESMGMASRYGIVGIPTVLLFYSGRAVAKYNRSRTAEDFRSFIKDYTGFEPSGVLEVLPEDQSGPLPTQVIERTTLHLTIAMSLLMSFLTYHLFGGLIWVLLRKVGADLKAMFVHEKIE